MARQFVSDGAEIYRVVVTTKKIHQNPNYDWRTAKETGEKPFHYDDNELVTSFYGPYKKSAAKGKLTRHMACEDYVSAYIEKANIMWEREK